jgi:hypothetical protein
VESGEEIRRSFDLTWFLPQVWQTHAASHASLEGHMADLEKLITSYHKTQVVSWHDLLVLREKEYDLKAESLFLSVPMSPPSYLE